MKIPIYPVKNPAVGKGGMTTNSHTNYHNQISQQLRYSFGADTTYLPVVYDPVTKKLLVNENGSFVIINHT